MIFIFAALLFSMSIFDYHETGGPGNFAILGGSNYSNYTSGYNYSSYVDVNGTSYSSTDVWQMFSSPFKGGGLNTVAMLILFATWITVIGLFNILGFGYRSDIAMLGPIFIFMLGMGLFPVVLIYNFFNRETAMYACSAATANCWFSEMFAALIAGSLLVMWVLACLEWWTQRSVSN